MRGLGFILSFSVLLCLSCCTVVDPHAEYRHAEYRFGVERFSEDHAETQRGTRIQSRYLVRPYDEFDIIFHFDEGIDADYRLEIADDVTINFLAASELSNVHKIRPDGKISLPYLGEIPASGRTTEQLRQDVEHLYTGILRDPSAFVVLKNGHHRLKNVKASLTHPQTGFSRIIVVRPDSRLSLPIIGDIDANGRDVDTLRRMINVAYKKLHPSISVDLLLKTFAETNLYVMGAVNRPGAYPLNQPIALLQALSTAGGIRPDGNIRSVIAVRQYENEVVAKVYDIHEVLEGVAGLAILQPNDMLYVSRSKLAKASEVARQIADVALFNGWGTGFNFTYRVDDKGLQPQQNLDELINQEQPSP